MAPRWLKREPCELIAPSPDDVRRLHETCQDALLELELATLEMNADEKWMVAQLL